jgi:hypothetical protein
MDALFINFQLKNDDGQVSGTTLKKLKTVSMALETGFSAE